MVKSKRVAALEARRDALNAELTKLDDATIERGTELTDAEQATYEAHDAELAEVTAQLKVMIEREQQIAASQALGASLGDATRRDDGKHGGKEEDHDEGAIYRESDMRLNPAADIFRAQVSHDPDAIDRLRKHNAWMVEKKGINILRAGSDTGDFGGLIIPEYATDEYAAKAREGRPFLNSLRSRPLTRSPIIIGKANVGAVAGSPAAENTAYVSAEVSTTPITLSAKTISGLAEVSVEAIEFSSVEPTILFGDLIEAYQTEFDRQAFWGSGAAGEHMGVLITPAVQGFTVIDGTTTTSFEETYAMVLQGAASVRTNDKRTATHVAMSSARWYSLLATTDADGRPIMGWNFSAPSNVAGQVGAGYSGVTFAGLIPVIDDNIVGVVPDEYMLVYRADEAVLREQNGGNPTTIRVDQAKAAQGTVQYIARGFSIYSWARRPKSMVVIENLPVPVFPLPAT